MKSAKKGVLKLLGLAAVLVMFTSLGEVTSSYFEYVFHGVIEAPTIQPITPPIQHTSYFQ